MNQRPTEASVLVAERVSKSYFRGTTETPVLNEVNLDVRQGECVFLVGPSGSGKSTLLSILGCILTPDSGVVRILGQDVSRLSRRQRTLVRRNQIGFVFQRFQLIRGLTAVENVAVPFLLAGYSFHSAKKQALQVLDLVGLAGQARSKPSELSAGQCQRIALARALTGGPAVILADEPTASLDARSGQQVMELLRNLTRELKRTAVVVTHDPRIFHFADRLCRMESGHLVPQAVTDEVLHAAP